jgi:L-2-hydroxyglutarate oxidase LhgO
MVTVRSCYSLPDAQVIQSHLEGSGIKAFLPDEYTVQNYWLWTNAIGGIRVQVLEEDAERAAEILKEESAADQNEAAKKCPHCGSTLRESYGFSLYFNIAVTLLFSIPIRTKATWHCSKCGIIPNVSESSET